MGQRYSLKRLLLCAILEFAALTGAPLRPKDIELALKPKNEIVSDEACRDDDESRSGDTAAQHRW
jgi:hypothetical protein